MKHTHRVVLASAMIFAFAGCEIGEEYEPFDDVEPGVVVLEGEALAGELAASPAREAPEPFVRLGLLFDAERPEALELATSPDGQTWSPWTQPAVHHTEVEGTSNFVGQLELAPDASARFYRLRAAAGAVSFVRMEPMASPQSAHIESGGEASPAGLRLATLGGAEVHPRSEWGARAPNCSSPIGDVYRMAIHHTETPTNDSMSPQARLRQIQSYHMDVKGWCDIGYHYLVSRDGRIWQGRLDTQLGSHAGGANTGNIGISIMGSHDATPVTQAQVTVIAGLVRDIATAHGIPIDRTRIKGHREYKSTSCPGNALFAQLEEIVSAAKNGGGGGGGGGGDGGGSCDLSTDAPWRCDGLTGTTTNSADTYYTTSFGCWVDASGNPRGDAGDNCIPACSLSSVGCDGLTGPACERMHNWYTAGADRFGCGSKVKVTNPDSGKSAVLIVLDRGPNCSIENLVDFWVLDMSYPASNYLFGGPTSATERADVQVEVVAASTPVGPTTASVACEGDPGGGGGGPVGAVTVMGVLYAGANTADRISGATVTLGGRTTTTSSTGLWQFADVPVGAFTVSASKTGYVTRSIARTTDGAETWASFGLSPAAPTGTAILQGVIYYGTSSSNRIPNAAVSLSTGQTITADGNGYYKLMDLPPGDVTISASAPGYAPGSVVRTLANGVTEWGSVRLAP